MHFAGFSGANWFFALFSQSDYDIIGLSFYPKWHGKDLEELATALQSLSDTYQKNICIVETAYPFTLDWNDWTNNLIGSDDQLILPDYPATETGQKEYLEAIRNVVEETDKGIGFCYWGAEWVAYKGDQATNGSPWENQALFDFDNMVLPVIEVFNP